MKVELLRQSEFDAHVASSTLRLSFIGMSNVGKSFRSKVLETNFGFLRYSVDDDIMHRLELASMEHMAEWLGFPYSPQYPKNENFKTHPAYCMNFYLI